MTAENDDAEIRRQVAENLQARFPEASSDEIHLIVREEYAALADQPVRDYIAVLTERAAKDRLRGLTA
jgi:lauroyl/myristoyl acyltransferase